MFSRETSFATLGNGDDESIAQQPLVLAKRTAVIVETYLDMGRFRLHRIHPRWWQNAAPSVNPGSIKAPPLGLLI